MHAIIKTGGKQYRVKAGDVIDVELLEGEAKSAISFSEVLLLESAGKIKIGSPLISGVTVKAEIVEQIKDDKVIIFKYKKRQNTRRKHGHRQKLSRVKVLAIEGGI